MSVNQLYTNTQSELFLYDYENLTTPIPVNTDIGQILKRAQNPNAFLENEIKKRNSIAIFTDASKNINTNLVGCACIRNEIHVTKMKSLLPTASIFTAECIAIIEALDVTLNFPNHRFTIISDALSVLTSLKINKFENKVNPYIHTIRSKFLQFKKLNNNVNALEFWWIPSHSGIVGNDDVDQLAKEAAHLECDINYKIPYMDFVASFRQEAILSTQLANQNKSLLTGTEYFNIYKTNSVLPWFTKETLPRKYITIINRCRANHYNLKASLARVGIIDNPICECLQDEQDLNHVLWNCPIFDDQRKKLYGKLAKCKIQPPLNVKPLLAERRTNILKYICQFFEECNLSI